jgi:hypothetical protein
MAEFKLDRFKYNWSGDWLPATEYQRDDIIRVNGRSYVCVIGHTSRAKFADDLNNILPGSVPPQPQPYWIVMTAGRSFLGNWATDTDYNLGDMVLLYGTIYECIAEHTSTTFEEFANNWAPFSRHISFENIWKTSTEYAEGALVRYNGIVYKCTSVHTSQATLEDDIYSWEVFFEGVEYLGDYVSGTTYRKNDLVRYGGSIFRCIETHTAGELIDDLKFEIEFPGNQFNGVWSPLVAYNQGDIVQYGGYLYAATANSIDQQPSRDSTDSTVRWTVLAKSNRFVGQWELDGQYLTGDVVLRGGNLWVALQDVNASDGDGSSVDYEDTNIWELLAPGKRFNMSWNAQTFYSKDDVVYYSGTAYLCVQDHQAESFNYPGDNGSGYTYWSILIQAGLDGGLNYKGDLLTYNLDRTVEGDTSSLGDTSVPIGEAEQVLSISSDLDVYWRNVANDVDVIYVSTSGFDEIGYGTSPSKPFKTIRYACEYVEDNFKPLNPVKVQVSTGRFEEICPISIPAGTAVMGDELRSTTVVAALANPAYNNAFKYVNTYVTRFKQLFPQLILLQTATITPGNTYIQDKLGPASSNAAIGDINALIDDYVAFIDSRIGSGSAPTMIGTNTMTSDSVNIYAGNIIVRNAELIAKELILYTQLQYPLDTLPEDEMRVDILHFLKAFKYDLTYTGNYKTLLSAERYANATLGSQFADIFRVRDTTGLRNMTTTGLVGTLNPPGVFDLYQRPTGGACVALDPGWGPDDQRVWINNRSPYIQGVTNIGTRCVGKKVDGALHNGGNKSMTSNDFTQVLSDGIGAWITNNGRAELVSVFTYYCQIGYFAEDGGVIRATNGNNSYGKFGSIATGGNINEIPDAVVVNNRYNDAQVKSAFAGGDIDEILVFEYTNAGEEYTTASAAISGSGEDATVEFDDFRDGSISRIRITNTKGSGSEGGAGYTNRQGFAQITPNSTSTIRISATDITQFESEILGMRVIIIAGSGVGQYGVITAYNNSTRDVTVSRDSDGLLGWDHVLPGTPIVSSLDSTAQYRIEPRVIADAPPYSSISYNLLNSRTFVDATYGGTRQVFLSLTGQIGTGAVDELVVPSAAKFNVTRSNRTYIVTLTQAGVGYAVGDVITILGSELGGADVTNDLTIVITEVTDDSSASIVSFTSSGTGRAGQYVFLADAGVAGYSDDGVSWIELNISFEGDYRRIISGHDRFIAIAYNENRYSFTYTGTAWSTRALPSTENWIDGAYGDGTFVLINDNSNTVAISSDGLIWTTADIPGNATGDSSTVQWDQITYGAGKFVVTSRNFLDVAYSTNNGATWTRVEGALPADEGDIIALEYGNNRYLTLSDSGRTAYSLDAITWYQGSAIDLSLKPGFYFTDLKFNQGVFVAVGSNNTPDTYFASTEDGLLWTSRDTNVAAPYNRLAISNLNNQPTFLLLASGSTSQAVNRINLGATAKVRADVVIGSFESFKLWDPGSGYDEGNMPQLTITDNSFTTQIEYEIRISNKVLAQPSFIHRGTGYRTSTSFITISGDGYADIVPEDNTIILDGVSAIPGPGVQLKIAGIFDETTIDPDDLFVFNGVVIEDLGDDGTNNNTNRIRLTISPKLQNEFNLAHGTTAELRSEYSQCRITGHDFLDIGTGNFEQTNYPEIYADGSYFIAAPENEVVETDGGRIFYLSTDQDGNFRAGELFSVQQATGIVTISAEFFDLDGLSQLALGGVRLGGSGAVVREFSTDPTFAEDSNNVVPTQRAIATFLANRLSVGGENLETFQLIAGRVSIGTLANIIDMTDGSQLRIPRNVTIDGVDANGNPSGVAGTFISQSLFLRNTFRE